MWYKDTFYIQSSCYEVIKFYRPDETFMNTFVFNVLLILICSVSLTQFAIEIFSDYCRLSTIGMFFGNQVRNLKFFKFFY